jgi:hypothetical protein
VRGLQRFVSRGLADADARVGNALAPRSFKAVDAYLMSSRIVRIVDSMSLHLRDWAVASETATALRSWSNQWQAWPARYQSIAIALLAAVTIHVALTVANGMRPGWYWMIIPGLAATLAVVILAGSHTQSPR